MNRLRFPTERVMEAITLIPTIETEFHEDHKGLDPAEYIHDSQEYIIGRLMGIDYTRKESEEALNRRYEFQRSDRDLHAPGFLVRKSEPMPVTREERLKYLRETAKEAFYQEYKGLPEEHDMHFRGEFIRTVLLTLGEENRDFYSSDEIDQLNVGSQRLKKVS